MSVTTSIFPVKPAPWASIYGSYVEAMEPGSRVGGEYANAGEVLKATLSRQYEVGAKYEHQRLSLTLAGFRIERAATAAGGTSISDSSSASQWRKNDRQGVVTIDNRWPARQPCERI